MQLTYKYLSIFAGMIALFGVTSCEPSEADFIGPSVISAPDNFKVTAFSASSSDLDFESDSASFAAVFSDAVTWNLTITGSQSGAQKTYTGLSNTLSDVIWKGGHDGVQFFRKAEKATATLSFFGSDQTESIDLNIAQPVNLTSLGLATNGGDFESDAAIDFPSWARFNVVEQGVDSAAIDRNGNLVKPVQGKGYYYIKGQGTQDVFVDGIQYLGPWDYKMPANPDSVYFNIYLYGSGDANARVEIEMQEQDFDGTKPGYTGTDDDAWVAKATLNHKGWKLFSFKYSDMVQSANLDFGGSGNAIQEPDRLFSFVLILLKDHNPAAAVEVYFDYPILTVGAPFNPSK